MALLTVQNISTTGLGPTYAAANAGGDTFPNNGRTLLHVKNGGASAVTVTLVSAKTCNQGFQHDLQVSVPAGGERMIGPFPPDRFNNESTGQVSVTYSGVTSVTVAALSI